MKVLYSEIRDDLNIIDVEKRTDEQLAYLTHYLQNISSKKIAKTFSGEAKKYVDSILNHNEAAEYDIDYAIPIKWDVPFPPVEKPLFTFIDLFAGIGGIRLAYQNLGGKCVFSSEWDKFAKKTYEANFGEVPFGDIRLIPEKQIPDHDLLLAGFPCQPFSIAGVTKKNALGRAHGFLDETQGTLFFDIARIIKGKRPKAFMLENVKNLVSHDKRNTFTIIHGTLKELGYSIFYKILDGKHFVPQHRERILIVGFDKKVFKDQEFFEFPKLPEPTKAFREILETNVPNKYTLTNHLWQYLQDYAVKHKAKGNGFGFGMTDINGISRTLSARYYKDGAEILVPQGDIPRRLTPRECARLQGFPDDFTFPVSDNQAYKQFGNSVVVPLIQFVGKRIVTILLAKQRYKRYEFRKP